MTGALIVFIIFPLVSVAVPLGVYLGAKKVVDITNKKDKEKIIKENERKVEEAMEKAKKLTESRANSLTFYEFDITGKPIEKPALMNLKITQSDHVTPENSTIFKGKVTVKDLKNNKDIEKEMYFYFPDLYVGERKIPIKPNLSTSGHLVDEAPYLIKNGKDGKYYTTIVPLAEAYTGIEFDFIKDSKVGPNLSRVEESQRKLSDYISVELKRDMVDDFIPVDFKDPVQKKAYEDYLASMKAKDAKEKGSAFKEVQGLILKAGESLGISKGENPDKYVVELEAMTDSYKEAPDASHSMDSSRRVVGSQQASENAQFRYIPRGSNYYRMGLYGINNGSGSLNSSAQSDDPYAYYRQFRYIPEGSVLDRIMDGNMPPVPHGTGPHHHHH